MTMPPPTSFRLPSAFSLVLLLVVVMMMMIPSSTTAQVAPDLDKYSQCPGRTVNPVVLEGKRFYDSGTGEYFPIKGLAYYPRPNNGTDDMVIYSSVDFFTDEYQDLWEQDIAYFQRLGINTLRIYAVDPSQNHDRFMCRLQEAGIYVMVGLLAECEGCNIGPDEAPGCYPPSLKERGQFIINVFSRYSNTLVFSAGNEVTLYATNRDIELNAPCQKKFLRDMRAYVNQCSEVLNTILPRRVPIGMVNWDAFRETQSNYFLCRTDPDDELENAEWYGMNIYQHCDTTAVTVEDLDGWELLRDDFAAYNHPVPIIVAEYGCKEPFQEIDGFEAQRNWLQVDALYTEDYVDVFAGGIVFEYSAEKYVVDQEPRGHPWPYFQFMKINYGLGYYSPVDCDHVTIPCEYFPYPEFDILVTKLEAVDNSFVPSMPSMNNGGDDSVQVGRSLPVCPGGGLASIGKFEWEADDEPDLPCYAIPTQSPTMVPSSEPTVAPTTASLTTFGQPTESPIMLQPNAGPTNKPIVDFVWPTDAPTLAPGTPSGAAKISMVQVAAAAIFLSCSWVLAMEV